MKFAGVVVLYNPDNKVFDNINSYLKFIDKLFVIDNSDRENNNKNIYSNFNKKIEYISNNGNLGIAYALNLACDKALKEKYDWILTMDQDSRFSKNGVLDMIDFIKKIKSDRFVEKISQTNYKKLGLVSPLHITANNKKTQQIGIESPLVLMTSGNLVNLKIWKKVGKFNEGMFIDCVDFDFCLKLRLNGYNLLELNFVRMDHELGDIIEKDIFNKKIYIDNHSAIRRYYIVRNRLYLNDLYRDEFPIYCKLELSRTKKEILKILLFEKKKIKKIKYIIRGYIDYKKKIVGKYNEK